MTLWVFRRYGQRDVSLYCVSVNTIFGTHCDKRAYRQWGVCFYDVDINAASCTHWAGMGHLLYGQGDSVSTMLT